MAYATGADLVSRYDISLVADLAQDSREPIDDAAVPSLPMVITALNDASGMIDVNITVGERYKPSDLAALLADVANNSRFHLIRVTCDIAMAQLLQRRMDPALMELRESLVNSARMNLSALARGENIFGIPSLQGAGVLDYQTVSAVVQDDRNLLTTRMHRYFPNTDTVTPR